MAVLDDNFWHQPSAIISGVARLTISATVPRSSRSHRPLAPVRPQVSADGPAAGAHDPRSRIFVIAVTAKRFSANPAHARDQWVPVAREVR
jgi:hypothetical protein